MPQRARTSVLLEEISKQENNWTNRTKKKNRSQNLKSEFKITWTLCVFIVSLHLTKKIALFMSFRICSERSYNFWRHLLITLLMYIKSNRKGGVIIADSNAAYLIAWHFCNACKGLLTKNPLPQITCLFTPNKRFSTRPFLVLCDMQCGVLQVMDFFGVIFCLLSPKLSL